MSPLKIGIVEDELLTAKSIAIALSKVGYTPLKPARNYTDALLMVEQQQPDLLLLDIVLEGEKDGIHLAHEINKQFHIPFIFLTANSDAATVNRAKDVNPYAYLIKPFRQTELYSSIEIAFNNFNEQKRSHSAPAPAAPPAHFLFIKDGDTFRKVQLNDILYIESDHVYLNIYTADKHYLVRNKLENFLGQYGQGNFFRTHRSFAINIHHLESITDLHVTVGKYEVPLGKTYKADLLNSMRLLK